MDTRQDLNQQKEKIGELKRSSGVDFQRFCDLKSSRRSDIVKTRLFLQCVGKFLYTVDKIIVPQHRIKMASKFNIALLLLIACSTGSQGFFGLQSLPSETWTAAEINAFCAECHAGMGLLINSKNDTEILMLAAKLCVDLDLGNEAVCNGIKYCYRRECSDLTAEDICGVVFQGKGCTTSNPDRIGNLKPTLKVLHLADTHYDPKYLPGANKVCDEIYLCCREENGIAADPSDAAGFWGSYGECDIPKWSLAALYQHISENHPDIDFIIWTGDIVPHNVWSSTRESNLAIINEMADLISEHFPDIPVYPAVGNHEANPISWLYDELSEVWQRWLPSDVASSIAYGAFYSTQIRPGLRIASINTQYCYGMNYWLVLDSNDLESLANELQDAEDKGDFVYIIGHIPSGSHDCDYSWSHEFNKIVSRYESTISGIFYGHTHNDHFELYFDPQNSSRVYEIAYIAQSQTTYTDMNPGYKIYTIEGDFNETRYRVIDHENWYLDLDQSNAINESY
ncbi:Sphingomyelin phosphodiesterase [Armadillidium vulgare]|nr:Sphingomyelin phosphodiesterase [Armadillidium vulgare]